ncbi:phosphoenolpyruvate--protein phosphotransferase [Helcococcus ovis]|uniref:Phosphoenolpyruvate-protein phosphotransferase n=2 Tax=Peptoniphilaceae TaxID=1570339 RepID=A0A4R9C2I7_9FIRM|nr:phosphoenolpyruvate--protein phosphotransferase [Helcococcus ovis]TFF67183.1 phosphoenolpyruvate--protein phosphotransferase [Helcococcus ovis]
MIMKYKGIAASDGVAMGKVYLFEKINLEISKHTIEKDKVEEEIEKVQKAINDYVYELENREVSSQAAKEVRDAHIELASDPALIDTTSDKIRGELINSEYALDSTIKEMVMVFEMMDDAYLKERAADYRDLGENVMYKLKGVKPNTLQVLDDDYIIVSEELTPTDTSTMDKDHVLGLAMDLGGKTSHSSIIAQTLGIPAIVGMKDITSKLKNDQFIILDAIEGTIIVDPDEETVNAYKKKFEIIKEDKAIAEKYKFAEAKTTDGKELEVVCNIGGLEDLKTGLKHGARGVGLFRTEFLYMESDEFPSEEKQFEVYKEAAEKLEGMPLIIRTLDIGGDKGLSYFEFPKEENPFLGWRALRVQFDKVDIMRDQLRAILRSSAYGNVKILLPMVISVAEIKKVQEYIETYKQELKLEGKKYDEDIQVGIMVETPASVFMARDLIKYCDFFSIGTNDLTQYILAADRGNEKISHLYDYFNPAVLRAIKQVIDASHEEGKWTGMCGSMSSDSLATYLLLGMGLDEFSVVSAKIGKLKSIINNTNLAEAEKFVQKVLSLDNINEIRALLKDKVEEF